MKSLHPTILASLLVSALTACSSPPPEELGVSWELAQHRAATISELDYHFDLTIPDEIDVPITGQTEVGFVLNDPDGGAVTLDFKDPTDRVQTLSVNGISVPWSAQNDHVVIEGRHFRDGERNVIQLLHRAGDEALNRSREFLYTLFVPDRAHFSLPLFDQPNLKGRVRWSLSVPEGWVAVANGPAAGSPAVPAESAGSGIPPEEVVSGESGIRRHEFEASEPIPTYLFAFAAGRFTIERGERDGRVFNMYHRETDRATVDRNRDAIFDLHATALAWLEDYTGIEYPFQKFDFVLIPPFQYGGMEHPGAVTYRQSSLMLDESATRNAFLGRASLIAHETAHMWFGDLVTMNWFDDVWTKEVFANFMAAKIVEPSFPDVNHRLRFLTAHHPSAYGVDRTPGANPIRQPLENLREAGTLYGPIIYQKAPIVMKQLERTVGEETFRDGLREYLAAYSYGNATWPDLIRILDGLHESDLAQWSRVWVEEPGRPVIRVGLEEDPQGSRTVVLTQEDVWGRDRLWPQEMELAAFYGGEPRTARITLDRPRVTPEGWDGVDPPDFVIPNASGLEYGLFLMDPDAVSATMAALPGIESELLRGAAWVNLREWLWEGAVEPGDALELALAAVEGEESELILGQILGTIGQVFWGMIPDSTRSGWAVRVEETLWRGLENAPDVSVRSSFFSAFRGTATTPTALRRLERIWAGEDSVPGLPLSENDRIALAEALALREVDNAEAILDRMTSEIENPDRRERFEWIRPSLSADPATREAFFETLRLEENRAREPWVLSAVGHLNHPLRRDHARRFVRPGLELVEEIQATGDIFFPQRWLGALLGGHNHPEVYRTVQAFLVERPDYPDRLRGKVLQAGDEVRRSALAAWGADDMGGSGGSGSGLAWEPPVFRPRN